MGAVTEQAIPDGSPGRSKTEFDRRLAQARTGQLGKTLSDYIAELVRADATASGMLALFSGKEADHG
jgi:hypothetical protein